MMLTVMNKSTMPSATLWPLLALAVLAISGCGNSASPSADSPAAPASEEKAEDGHAGEEKEHAGEEEEGHVELTPEQIKNAGIVLAQAGPAAVHENLPLYGVVVPNAERVREVAGRFAGVILTVTKRVGDSVRQGEPLATIESNESLQTYSVVSPLNGMVTARNANPGEQAGDKSLFTVADLSTVWVELSVFPRDIAKVRVGQSVRVKSNDTGLSAEGRLVYVAPFGTSSNQTLTARVLVENPERKWPPGLYVTAAVSLSSTTVTVAVSNDALQTLEERTVVFVQHAEGFEPRAVKLGRSDDEIAEVVEGIAAGETYATKNSFILKAELGKGDAEHGH